MSLYNLTGHPHLSEEVADQGAEHLEWLTKQAEAALGAVAPAYTGPALDAALDALVIQVNWLEETGVDARMLKSAARAGVTFREDDAGSFPLVDPMAQAMWDSATRLQEEQDAAAAVVVVTEYEQGLWRGLRGVR